jgi:LPS-assembly protein
MSIAVPTFAQECPATPPTQNSSEVPSEGDESVSIDADSIHGHQDKEVEALGSVVVKKGPQTIFADKMLYSQPEDQITASGNVRFERGGDVIVGPKMQYNLETEQGYIDNPAFTLQDGRSHGAAESFRFEGQDKYHATGATYTTCPESKEDWFIRAKDLKLDVPGNIGKARNATIEFKGVPILYTPYIDFPLREARKTGFLSPVFANTDTSGSEFTLPFYWNIAPHRDATLSPRIMSKRGIQLNNEFRYLDSNYSGETEIDVLPDDRVFKKTRYGLAIKHRQSFGGGWGAALDFNKVSDDTYFTDLTTTSKLTAQTNLLRDAYVSYGASWWGFTGRLQRYQTLQDPLAPVTPPYHRLPQLTSSGTKQSVFGSEFSYVSEFVDFHHPTLPNGKRFLAYPSLSLPLRNAFAYSTPKIGVHYTRYDLDSNTTSFPDTTRSLPIVSLDNGLIFERDMTIGSTSFIQTVEPRIYYLYVPFRNQDRILNFDTGVADINFAQIYSENLFAGSDRINDANQVTIGISSRIIDPDSGTQRFAASIAQRYHFKTQEVALPGVPLRDSPTSDLLAAIGGTLAQHWVAEAGLQYNTDFSQTQKLSFGARYNPQPGKVLNFGYRFTLDQVKQFDLSAQWPLSANWSGLARWNYSVRDDQIIDGIAGLEYHTCCWALRLVAHRLATTASEVVNSFFIQLELNGVSKVGSNPLETLRQNIPGYTKLN